MVKRNSHSNSISVGSHISSFKSLCLRNYSGTCVSDLKDESDLNKKMRAWCLRRDESAFN